MFGRSVLLLSISVLVLSKPVYSDEKEKKLSKGSQTETEESKEKEEWRPSIHDPFGHTGEVHSFGGFLLGASESRSGYRARVGAAYSYVDWDESDTLDVVDAGISFKGTTRFEDLDQLALEVQLDSERIKTIDPYGSGLYYGIRQKLKFDIPIYGDEGKYGEDPQAGSFRGGLGGQVGIMDKDPGDGSFLQMGFCVDALYQSDGSDEMRPSDWDLRVSFLARHVCKISDKIDGKIRIEAEVGGYVDQDSELGEGYGRLGLGFVSDRFSVFTGIEHDPRGVSNGDRMMLTISPDLFFPGK